MKAMSDARRQAMIHYTKMKRVFMREHPICQRPGCKRKSEDLHHKRGRVASLLTDVRHWSALCRSCHNFVGENPEKARAMGLLCERGKWNTPDRS